MPEIKPQTSQQNQSSQSPDQEFEQRYQQWLEKEMLRQDYEAFYHY
ncbi:MAG: hypothetical protein QNJ63_02455 [Calothrix sp. MO_192.B10]|nr:hypothetical protein [Calothrix sp. MO_192.B10]